MHSRVAFLPFTPLTLKRLKLKHYSESPTTTGEHLQRGRIMKGLLKKEAAKLLGVTTCTYKNWELGYSKLIPARFIPRIIDFLGYNPEPEAGTDGERVARKRRSMGLAAYELAQHLKLDEQVVNDFEADLPCPPRAQILKEFIQENFSLQIKSISES
jgi:DNA-binding XRE family transcriptional regulator